MKKIALPLLSITIIFLAFFTSSCNHSFYAPTSAPTSLFREQGETQISAHLGNGNEIKNSFQVQGAYAYSSSMAMFASYYTASGKDNDNENNYGNGMQGELAVGHFKAKGNHKSYEIYGGSAFGSVNNKFNKDYEIKNNFVKPFLQGNYGYRSSFFDLAFTTRLAFLHIGGISERNDSGFVNDRVNMIKSNPNSFLIEPGVTLRVGKEPLKFQMHYGMSFNMNGNNYPQEKSILSFGLVAMLHSSTKRTKS